MTNCTFDDIAFDDITFDTCQPTPPTHSGWHIRRRLPPFPDDEDLLLAAWIMYMNQSYQIQEQNEN